MLIVLVELSLIDTRKPIALTDKAVTETSRWIRLLLVVKAVVGLLFIFV